VPASLGEPESRLRAHGPIASVRVVRLARSKRATSSAGISYSPRSRQAKTTKVAKAPSTPTIASQQMCQIMAKPTSVVKKAQMKPVRLFSGISMAS
jgi:hypothetical protein